MNKFIALLRGINVSGQKLIKMEDLRKSFVSLGFEDVVTYVQSGNVVFSSPKASPQGLAKKISDKIMKDFGFDVSVIIRQHQDLLKVTKKNPYSKKKGVDLKRLYVIFLSETPTKEALKNLAGLKAPGEYFEIQGNEIHLYFTNGYGKAKLTNNVFEKVLSQKATTRNWNTVNALIELCQ